MNEKTRIGSQGKNRRLPTWRIVLHAVRFTPWLWLIDFLSAVIFRVCWQIVPGLLLRSFFNLITGETAAGLNIYSIIALFIAIEAGRQIGRIGFAVVDPPLFVMNATRLRRNLLQHILNRPSASTLPDSPGEAVSRFREDVEEIPLFVLWFNDSVIGLCMVLFAVWTMLRINASITLIALGPFILVGLAASIAAKQIDKYQKASRAASGVVTGFIGEAFGAVQAVKVAAAESSVSLQFEMLSDKRRFASLQASLFYAMLNSLYANAASLGTGVILILAGELMHQGTFTNR